MGRSLEQQLSELYISNFDIIAEGFPLSVNNARGGYMENFMLQGLPGNKDERYRHTDMQKVFSGDWEHYFTPQQRLSRRTEMPVEGYRIDILNGFCTGNTKLEILDNGITLGSLKQAMTENGHPAAIRYNTAADNENESVTALNSAFMQDGAFVYVPEGVHAALPVIISFDYESDEQAQMCFPRVLIVLEQGAHADIVISHSRSGNTKFLADSVYEVFAAKNARLKISESSCLGRDGILIVNSYLRQSEGSCSDMMNVWLEGGTTRVNTTIDLSGRECESNLYTLYTVTGTEQADIDLRINHNMPDCRSTQLVKGVASGQATGAFTGRVLVAPDAQRTSAMQQSRNLQLSDTARIYTEPQLEIYADDVKCSHGATVGQIDDDAIFYMRQRGISEQEARRLQLFGFVNDIVSRCTIPQVCDYIREAAEKRIGEL